MEIENGRSESAEDVAFGHTRQVANSARLPKKRGLTLVQLEISSLEPAEIRNNRNRKNCEKVSTRSIPKSSAPPATLDSRKLQISFSEMASMLGGAA